MSARPPRSLDVVSVASWNADLTAHVQHPLLKGETVLATGFGISPGGKGSNAAVAAARQGARTALIARVGNDSFGQMGLALWRAEGIDAGHVLCVEGEQSGVAQITVYADGDNSIAVYPGATQGLTAEHVAAAAATIAASGIVIASCEVPLAATQQAFTIARAAGVITLLNPAPAIALPDALWPLIDWLTPNETELRSLAGLPADADEAQAAQRLIERGCAAVLVTRGGDGCCLYRPGQAPHAQRAYPAQVVDTVGAGDTFTGALAAALARGEAIESAMQWASAAAALAVTGAGAIAAMPDRAATERLLREVAA